MFSGLVDAHAAGPSSDHFHCTVKLAEPCQSYYDSAGDRVGSTCRVYCKGSDGLWNFGNRRHAWCSGDGSDASGDIVSGGICYHSDDE